MFWKWFKRIGLGFLCLIGLLLMIGAAYQWISTKLDAKRYPAPGQLVDIGGYKLHLYNAGSGGPAVILDAGLGGFSSSWGLVQPKIAQFTQVVSYDRAGTGWSEPSPFPRTSQQIVRELHTLLQNAHIPKPYILVGHSFGGINVRLYAATYPVTKFLGSY
jgi:pimeloyl-ACP methyl ester carboxylesterase